MGDFLFSGSNVDLLLNQLLNALLQNLPSHPSAGGVKGRVYFNTTENKPYYHNGTAWVAFGEDNAGGLLSVISDSTLTGVGTSISPLGIAASILADISGKQEQLSSGQLAAVNSGVTTQIVSDTAAALSNIDGGSNPVLRVLSVLDVLNSTDADKPLSANQGRILNNKIAEAMENGMNMGAFNTKAALLSAYPVPPAGAYAYVRADESQNPAGNTWRYDQGLDTDGTTRVWSATIKLNEVPRDFTAQPIAAAELAEGAVTLVKIAAGAFDGAPASGSDNLVRSGAIFTYLANNFVALTGNQTIAGEKTFTNATTIAGMKIENIGGDVKFSIV